MTSIRIGPHGLEDAVQPYLRVCSVRWVYGAGPFRVYRDKHSPRWLIHLELGTALLIALLEKHVKTSGLSLTVEMISLARNSIQFPDPLFEQQTNKIGALQLQAHLLHKYQEARGSCFKYLSLNNASSQSCYPLPWMQPHSISRLK